MPVTPGSPDVADYGRRLFALVKAQGCQTDNASPESGDRRVLVAFHPVPERALFAASLTYSNLLLRAFGLSNCPPRVYFETARRDCRQTVSLVTNAAANGERPC